MKQFLLIALSTSYLIFPNAGYAEVKASCVEIDADIEYIDGLPYLISPPMTICDLDLRQVNKQKKPESHLLEE